MMRILIASNNRGKLVEIQALLTPASGLAEVELVLPHQLGLALEVVEDGQTYAENAALKAQAFYRAAQALPAQAVGRLIILADDSGLEVDRLGGKPGIHSARYSPNPSADSPKSGPSVPKIGTLFGAGALRSAKERGLCEALPGPQNRDPLRSGGFPQNRDPLRNGGFAKRNAKRDATDADRRAFLLQNLAGKPRPWLAHFHCTVALISPGGELAYAEGDCPGEIWPEERGSNGFGYDPIFLLPGMGRTMAELTMPEKNEISHRARAVKAALPTIRRWMG